MIFSSNTPNLKIWDNAAFDQSPLQPISINTLHSPNLDQTKDFSSNKHCNQNFNKENPNHNNIDAEIEELEKEIRHLSLKLESLRIQKAERDLKNSIARRGRIIPARFLEQKPCFQKLEGIKEENSSEKIKKDSLSSCYKRRGKSLCPAEISLNSRSRLSNKLHEIKEKKMRESLSMSPRSRKLSVGTMFELRKGISTVSGLKSVNREDFVVGLKPKKLFHERKNQFFCKKPLKNSKVRIVASRYSLADAHSDEPQNKRRKWSLLEPGNCSLLVEESRDGSEEIQKKTEKDDEMLLIQYPPPSIMKIGTKLPKIRTLRNKDESPRDSGCAKRVSQLDRTKSHFSMEDDQDCMIPPCNSLKFEEY